MIRMITVSTQPPMKPATRPIEIPPAKAIATTTTPMNNEKRAPCRSRERMSRPDGVGTEQEVAVATLLPDRRHQQRVAVLEIRLVRCQQRREYGDA